MRGRFWTKATIGRRMVWVAVGAALMMGTYEASAANGGQVPKEGSCRRGVLEGEVRGGESFVRPIGGGLVVKLDALSWGSGWAIRLVPKSGMPKGLPEGVVDYAQLATPPYSAVNPLLLSTDYSFRAQDAVAWNPRRFRYAAGTTEFARLEAAYSRYRRVSPPTAESENELAAIVSKEPEGTFEILDAHLIPGMANQAGTAALVATHFNTTAHTVEEPVDGKGLPLGKLMWLRFRITLDLPKGFLPDKEIKVQTYRCD